MFLHVLTLALLLAPADVADQPVKATADSAKLTTLMVGDVTFSARTVQFRSGNGSQRCTLEGDAKVRLGDITIKADRIQINGKLELESLVCTGNCTWQQEDGSGEDFSGDTLELPRDSLRLTGNVSLRFGSDGHITVITCDSITSKNGNEGYEFSGTMRLQHGK